MKRILLSILASGILLLGGCGATTTEPPAPTTYTLSAGASPSGGGSVSPSGGEYEEGTEVKLAATAASGYTFDYWEGDASGSLAATTVIMDSDKSVTACFAIVEATTYTLSVSVSPSGGGSVSPSEGEYEEGTEVTVTATPTSDYTFYYWGGDVSGSRATTAIIMDSDKSITAHFASKPPPKPAITQEDIDAARQVVLEYWEGRKSYDVERTLACLEESYRLERAEEVASEISQMQSSGVKMEVEEEAEPVITDEGVIEIRMKLKLKLVIPLPDRHITYYMVKVDGEWKIGRPPEEEQ